MQLAQNAYYKKFKDAFENQEVESYYDDLYNNPNSGMSIDKNPSQSLYTYREVLKSAERSPDAWLSDIKKWHNVNNQQAKQMIANSLAGTKQYNKDPNIIYYKDLITPRIDPGAPFSIYDKRIKPQGVIERTPKIGANFPGENVNTFYYDPLAVKPYNMRTPQEKIEWEKKYGKKETTKAKPTPPPAKKKVVTPETVRQTIPPAAIPSSASSVKSVSEKVGKLDMFGKKDVELLVDNFGNYEWFRKDDDIGDLKPIRRATREEIEYSKKQKQRNGGVNKADEYPIEKLDQLLNFTNYNKPTKGGWLDKYN